MISHKNRTIFIHIPKCAGSSIERYFGVAPFNWKVSNRLHLTGWDPQHCLHLQHARARDLIEMKLVDRQIWDQYFKFSFVRNPYDRAHSDYLWMMKDRGVSGTFEEYITASGPFERFLAHSQEKITRNEHLTPQYEFLYDENGALLVDKVYRFESLEADFKDICNRLGITYSSLPHVKKNTQKAHYRDFYDVNTKSLVEEKYGKDLELFNYSF